MHKKKIIILSITLITIIGIVKGQDAAFSQFYSSSLYLNPALAGNEQALTLSTNYRTQWRSIVLPYVTSQASIIHPIYKEDFTKIHVGGFGVSMFNDRAGDGNFKTLGLNLNFAYNLWLDQSFRHRLSVGLQAGFVQKRVDYTNLQWGEQFNPFIGFDATIDPTEADFGDGRLYPDFSVGIMYHYDPTQQLDISPYIGISFYHINRPDESFVNGVESKLPLLVKINGGLNYRLSEDLSISPNVLFLRQAQQDQLNLGVYGEYKVFYGDRGILTQTSIIGGVWYRVSDAVITSLGLTNANYTIAFSYDYNTSSLRFATRGRGAYEISLTLRKFKEQTTKRYATPRI